MTGNRPLFSFSTRSAGTVDSDRRALRFYRVHESRQSDREPAAVALPGVWLLVVIVTVSSALIGCGNQQPVDSDGTTAAGGDQLPNADGHADDSADHADGKSADQNADDDNTTHQDQPAVSSSIDIHLPEPSTSEPVAIGAGVSPARLKPGDSGMIEIRAKMAPTWHIYGVNQPPPSIPTSFELELPDGFSTDGDWQFQPAEETTIAGEQAFVYHDQVSFRRSFQVGPDAATGPFEIVCDLKYQACTDSACMPPKTVKLAVEAEVVRAED